MVQIEFDYEQIKTIVQANLTDKFDNILQKYKNKSNIDLINKYFLYNGRNIQKTEVIENIINTFDKQNKLLKILVNDIETRTNIQNPNIIKSKDVICPICKGVCQFKIEDYKIIFFGCKNRHIKKNIKLNQFDNTQLIDISKIECEDCKAKNKSETYNNEFYLCGQCKINLCPLCKSAHDNNHSIINYDLKNCICNIHKETFVKFCKDCDKDICFSCFETHRNHKLTNYEDILTNIDAMEKNMTELRNTIDKFKENINENIRKLNVVMEYMEYYYNINKNIIDNYNNNKNKYNNKLLNLRQINNEVNKQKKLIIDEYNFGNNINSLLNLYTKMTEDNYEIKFLYKPKPDNKNKVRIFGDEFIKNNINNCKIIYNNKEYQLTKYINDIIIGYNNKNSFEIGFKIINTINDMSYMFSKCDSLISLPDISKIDTSNVTNMCNMFSECESLISLPDISFWDTSNVCNMRAMFSYCKSLKTLPDISRWDTSNVTNMGDIRSGGMFIGCKSLISLPDISKWNTSNVEKIRCLFQYCESLKWLPDISKWNTSKVSDMCALFSCCYSLLSLPDISKWDTSNVFDMDSMFSNSSSLISLPDISIWNTSKVIYMKGLFRGCKSLSLIPDISKWDTSEVKHMDEMFSGCKSLLSLPDISKWNISKVENKSDMFKDCNKSLKIPSKFTS